MNGRVIAGRYELSTLLGQGGMGQVWLGYDRRLDRRIAVKLLRPDRMAGAPEAEEMRRRFLRECRVTARVDHPGLVTVHDAGSDGDDLYLVMQHIDGADLGDHLAEHEPYPWPWAASVAAQLCAVLSAVHAAPVVHRDLKPRNVMLRQDGTVCVLDLGIAAAVDTDTTRLTHTGSPIGSPAYMAPEQAMGGAVGPYTDLYALGVLLHELLSGQVPFQASTSLGVLHRHLYDAPVPVRQLRSEVPEPLEALVLRLLAKDPRHRPSGAQEVYQALVPLLPSPGSAPGGSPGPLDPTRPFLRPHAPWPDRAGALPAPPAVMPAPAAAIPDPRSAAGGAAGGAATPQRTGRTAIADAVEEVKRLLDAGRLTQAVDVLGSVLPLATAHHGEHSPVVRSLRKQYAATLLDDGQYRRALPELRRLAAETSAGSGPDAHREALQFRYEAAQCLEQLGEASAAIAEYRAVLPYFEQDTATGPALPLEIRARIGALLHAVGAHREAHETQSRLLGDVERMYGPYHPMAGELRRVLDRQRQVRLG
ncbi:MULTISPECIES: serine/threonine-protein kinase [Streptomyces]|uniref:non-specific serine/threonine protein kinase n=2 Tax=Streptomyces TaxID=1883 RepID=A0A3R7ETM3_9ACTN|nr:MULTISPECIES: serine/threonine-protein kinase [Streptomyces]KNE80024.1 protein kinase [Streptomyces fradiae]PQM20152.1 serine/threonine protein kinase [Streptomyces xinghaiensis]RKM96078.1 serine/threonine protein kinase [Streptomyces xinghaiensis]RNC70032.1 serine/threonine protein kinase [Streptomyces xinghaiensis]